MPRFPSHPAVFPVLSEGAFCGRNTACEVPALPLSFVLTRHLNTRYCSFDLERNPWAPPGRLLMPQEKAAAGHIATPRNPAPVAPFREMATERGKCPKSVNKPQESQEKRPCKPPARNPRAPPMSHFESLSVRLA